MVATEAVNVMLMVQELPTASDAPQVLACANSLPFMPVTAILLMVNVPGPRLLKVVFTAGLVLPTVWARKLTQGTETVGCGVVCGMGRIPKTSSSFCVPTKTFPFAIVGAWNLFPQPP